MGVNELKFQKAIMRRLQLQKSCIFLRYGGLEFQRNVNFTDKNYKMWVVLLKWWAKGKHVWQDKIVVWNLVNPGLKKIFCGQVCARKNKHASPNKMKNWIGYNARGDISLRRFQFKLIHTVKTIKEERIQFQKRA